MDDHESKYYRVIYCLNKVEHPGRFQVDSRSFSIDTHSYRDNIVEDRDHEILNLFLIDEPILSDVAILASEFPDVEIRVSYSARTDDLHRSLPYLHLF